jgi:oligopeptide/dipeptide ABC transporter ATP-binding protein
MSLLEVNNLSVSYPDAAEPAVKELCFSLERGDSLGVVGESGAGKTQTALAIMGLLPANARVHGGVSFDGTELVGAPTAVLNRIRARKIAMVFQDPLAALNPYVAIGKQLGRILLEHGLCEPGEVAGRTLAMLNKVGLPDPERQYRAFPHQLSGGMRQRVMIGAALLGEPDLVIADEPTTALDVTVQAQILHLLKEMKEESGVALLLITHDLGVVAGNCRRMLVMDQGRMLEEGTTGEIFACPDSAKMRALLAAAPRITAMSTAVPPATGREVILDIHELSVSFAERRGFRHERLRALRPMNLTLFRGETLAIVGESGSGKTSLARALVGLIPADSGRVMFLGKTLPALVNAREQASRREMQMVFQDPLASLNPAMRISDIVAEPLRVHEPGNGGHEDTVEGIMAQVGLGPELLERYPHELSGGQAQRVAIARALVLRPKMIICDEAVAALDGTVQNEILELLQAEQARSGLSLIFITHDIAVVRQISHRVLVMYMGRLCELATNEQLFGRPRHPYTKALLNAVPVPDPMAKPVDALLSGEVASIMQPPSGCVFHPRCQHSVAACMVSIPEWKEDDGSLVACHRAKELDLSYQTAATEL